MFRFKLGSIPVSVHFSHLLTSAVLALSFTPGARQGFTEATLFYVVSWMFIVFVSVLVHELGHALVSKAYGYQPSISLEWMGGHTLPNAPGPIPWQKDVLLTLAGPLFGLMLGGACWVGDRYLGERSQVLGFLLGVGAVANFFWAGFNLVPVLPLDGGRIVHTVAVRFFGRAGFIAAQGLAVLIAVGAVAWGVRSGWLLMTVFFGMWGFQAVRAIAEALRSGPMGEKQRPLVEALHQAQEAASRGEFEVARERAVAILEAGEALTPQLASHAHHMLGWIAVKQGQGRTALDHFTQVQGQSVESHLLAAAFSLVGDDTRAQPLWEKAWRDSGDRTVMHEYAGCLIRVGKVEQALKLPNVDPASAFTCAERVFFIRGAYSEAAATGEAALAHAPSAQLAYDAACAFAKAHNTTDALRLLHRARELGYRDVAYAASDEDLAPLHGHPGFESWLTELRQSAAS